MEYISGNRRRLKIINKLVAAILMSVFLAVSCSKKVEEAEYEVTEVKTGNLTLTVSKTGQVVTENEVSVYTTSNQRVKNVYFKTGDNVKKGDVVLTFYTIDRNESQRNINKKLLEIRQKERNLKNAEELFKVGGETRVNVEDARIALETAKLELASLQEDRSLIVESITSPVDGVITAMTADENYRVNTETTLFKVSDSTNMRVEVSLSDTEIKNIAVDQRVEITSDSLPENEKVEGYVSQVSGVATKSESLDESNTVVKIKMNDPKTLKPGATIKATIFYKEDKNVLKIPYSAVLSEEGKYYVFLVDKENVVKKTEIQVGDTDDSTYVVTSGLSSGDKIVSSVDETLKDGQKIKIHDPSKPRKNSSQKSDSKRGNRSGGGPGGGPGGGEPGR